jgi:hypothetical protein
LATQIVTSSTVLDQFAYLTLQYIKTASLLMRLPISDPQIQSLGEQANMALQRGDIKGAAYLVQSAYKLLPSATGAAPEPTRQTNEGEFGYSPGAIARVFFGKNGEFECRMQWDPHDACTIELNKIYAVRWSNPHDAQTEFKFFPPAGVNIVRFFYRYILPPNMELPSDQVCLIDVWANGLLGNDREITYGRSTPGEITGCTVSLTFHVGMAFPGLRPGDVPPSGFAVGIRFFEEANNIAFKYGANFVFVFRD